MEIGKKVHVAMMLRERRAARKKAFEEDDMPDRQAEDKLDVQFLAYMADTGTTQIHSEFGTVYPSTRSSVTVADWEVVSNFIKENMELRWGLLEKRISKKFVDEYLDETKEMPPGINITRVITVCIRKPT